MTQRRALLRPVAGSLASLALWSSAGLLAASVAARTAPPQPSIEVAAAADVPGGEVPWPGGGEAVRVLVLAAPVADGAGEPIPGPVTERLGRLARANRAIVGASLVEEPPDEPGARYLTLVLVGADGTLLHRSRAVMPVVPVDGVMFKRGDFRDPLRSVEASGTRIGIAALGDAEVAIPRLSDRGATLILLSGGMVAPDRIEPLAALARANRVALAAVASGSGRPGEASSLVIGRDGREATAAIEGLRPVAIAPPPPRWSPASASGLPQIVPQPLKLEGSAPIAELGRRLFVETGLSETGTVSCATCHVPERAFANGKAFGDGVHSRTTKRNVPSLLNVAFRPVLRWDGYASSLENFVKYPLSGFTEMNFHYLDAVVAKLEDSESYRRDFDEAFGSPGIDFPRVERALAAYMRTLVSGNAPFDRAVSLGRREAMSPPAWRGYRLFTGKAGCAACHTAEGHAPFFTDFKSHNTGLGWDPAAQRYRDIGVGGISTDALSGSFMTPSLRDVARSAPYMHDGSLPTLRSVIDFFDRGGGDGAGKAALLRPLGLSEREKRDLEAFLEALTGEAAYDSYGRRLLPERQRTAELRP